METRSRPTRENAWKNGNGAPRRPLETRPSSRFLIFRARFQGFLERQKSHSITSYPRVLVLVSLPSLISLVASLDTVPGVTPNFTGDVAAVGQAVPDPLQDDVGPVGFGVSDTGACTSRNELPFSPRRYVRRKLNFAIPEASAQPVLRLTSQAPRKGEMRRETISEIPVEIFVRFPA